MPTETVTDPDVKRRSRRAHRAILDATVRLLEADGYRNLTIEGVAAEAGVTKTALYTNFGSKDRLVVAYLRDRDRRWQSDIDRITADAPVRRLSGANRYETAAKIAAQFGSADIVFVATGENFPDALAGSARAGALHAPLLLVEHNLKVVEGLCDHITVLARGEVLAQGDYASVSANPEVQAAYLGTDPTFAEAAHV